MRRVLDRVLYAMPSERQCLRCGCVRARHPARYCTYHGPEGCRRFIPAPRLSEEILWFVLLVVWATALVLVVRTG